MAISTPLTPLEQDSLEHHLAIIKSSFVIMVRSLAIIHSQRLYRGEDGLQTWAQFCQRHLNFSARLGYYFVQACEVLDTIEAHNQNNLALPLPTNEAQTRVLATTDDLIIPVWQATTARYGDSPTARNIKDTIADMTTKEALLAVGVTDVDVIEALETLADKSSTGYKFVTELVVTGYLQGSDEDAIPLADVRVADLRRWEDDNRREAIARRVADAGGVVITIYPSDMRQTARALAQVMGYDGLQSLKVMIGMLGTSVASAKE